MKHDPERMLLIVDPQIDFITGSLPVPGAEKAMNALADYIREHGDEYGHILITCDQHDLRHTSFKEFGGKWPMHCVESSVGAAIWPPLMEALVRCSFYVQFLYKGQDIFRDEYSIFSSERGRSRMYTFLRDDQVKEVDICGLAGDVCVNQTLVDAMELYPGIHYRILPEFTASLDGGATVERNIEMLHRLSIMRTEG